MAAVVVFLASHVIVCLSLIAVTSTAEPPQPLVYSILEEQAPGTPVADVMKDANIYGHNQTRNIRRPAHIPSFQILQSQSNFVIDQHSGIIRTATTLDRDSICPRKPDCPLEINVAVYLKKGSPPTLIKVIFHLIDLNDNSPTFPKSHIMETISEATQVDQSPLPFFIQPADDLDSPANGVVRYKMDPESDTFGLQVEMGEDGFQDIRLVLKEPLDREKRDHYQIRIFAFDGGSSPRSGNVTIQIYVDDVNDNAPVFSNATYRVEIGENTPPQRSLVAALATDADIGLNGRVTYSFSSKTSSQYGSNFSVDPASGIVSLLTPIDYEKTKQVILEIVAIDGGDLPLPTTARVSIEVKDANDNAPEIRLESASVQSGTNTHPVLYVTENSPPNHYVALLVVSDADSGANGRVHCVLYGSQFQLVQIADKDFKIVTGNAIIDRETVDRHYLNVTCSDRGTPRRFAVFSIVVVVEDLNDNKPMFTLGFYNFSIEENNRENASVGQVAASDADKEKNAEVEYRLQQNASSLFSIDHQTGVIRALRRFDREVNSSYRFLVYASDFGPERWHSSAEVQVNILDQDDEGPRFTLRRYEFDVPDSVPSFTVIGQVLAIDRDQPPRNRFTYYLDIRPTDAPPSSLSSSSPFGPEASFEMLFGVNTTSGLVYTRSRIIKRSADYSFTVVAKSKTDPPRKDRALVIIHVTKTAELQVAEVHGSGRVFWPWWQRLLTGVGLAVLVGAMTGSVVLVALIIVIVAAVRRWMRKNKSSSKETIRSSSFWSNPDALTPPPPGSDNGKAIKAVDNDYVINGRRPASSSTDDVSDEDMILPNGNHPDLQAKNSLQCQWCSSTDLDMPAPPASLVVYDNQMVTPGDIHAQNLGNCGFRPIGDATNGSWREKYMTTTPPSEYRRHPYSTNSSPMHMASMYQIKHHSRPGGGGSGTLERRTVRFQGNADNDFRRMYGDIMPNPAFVTNGNDTLDFPPPSQI